MHLDLYWSLKALGMSCWVKDKYYEELALISLFKPNFLDDDEYELYNDFTKEIDLESINKKTHFLIIIEILAILILDGRNIENI